MPSIQKYPKYSYSTCQIKKNAAVFYDNIFFAKTLNTPSSSSVVIVHKFNRTESQMAFIASTSARLLLLTTIIIVIFIQM